MFPGFSAPGAAPPQKFKFRALSWGPEERGPGQRPAPPPQPEPPPEPALPVPAGVAFAKPFQPAFRASFRRVHPDPSQLPARPSYDRARSDDPSPALPTLSPALPRRPPPSLSSFPPDASVAASPASVRLRRDDPANSADGPKSPVFARREFRRPFSGSGSSGDESKTRRPYSGSASSGDESRYFAEPGGGLRKQPSFCDRIEAEPRGQATVSPSLRRKERLQSRGEAEVRRKQSLSPLTARRSQSRGGNVSDSSTKSSPGPVRKKGVVEPPLPHQLRLSRDLPTIPASPTPCAQAQAALPQPSGSGLKHLEPASGRREARFSPRLRKAAFASSAQGLSGSLASLGRPLSPSSPPPSQLPPPPPPTSSPPDEGLVRQARAVFAGPQSPGGPGSPPGEGGRFTWQDTATRWGEAPERKSSVVEARPVIVGGAKHTADLVHKPKILDSTVSRVPTVVNSMTLPRAAPAATSPPSPFAGRRNFHCHQKAGVSKPPLLPSQVTRPGLSRPKSDELPPQASPAPRPHESLPRTQSKLSSPSEPAAQSLPKCELPPFQPSYERARRVSGAAGKATCGPSDGESVLSSSPPSSAKESDYSAPAQLRARTLPRPSRLSPPSQSQGPPGPSAARRSEEDPMRAVEERRERRVRRLAAPLSDDSWLASSEASTSAAFFRPKTHARIGSDLSTDSLLSMDSVLRPSQRAGPTASHPTDPHGILRRLAPSPAATEEDSGVESDTRLPPDSIQQIFPGYHQPHGKRTSLVLRTQLSVRVHAIIEKLLNSSGRELRRALFSLKQIFQEDKDLVHEFVGNDGLACLIKLGTEADQNYQNYILRALGQLMLYVDGMNGVIAHNETVQWLYGLLGSPYRLVLKTALKLLLVFVEYTGSNSVLLLAAVYAVEREAGTAPWSLLMGLLADSSQTDPELLTYAMSFLNKTLHGIPDQDTYYDIVDALDEQGMEGAVQRLQGLGCRDLAEQCRLYETVLTQEDAQGDQDPHPHDNVARMRNTGLGRQPTGAPRRRNGVEAESGRSDGKNRVRSLIKGRDEPPPQPQKELTPPPKAKYGGTPGMPTNKRITMDLLYRNPSQPGPEAAEEEASQASPPAEPSVEEELRGSKCPPPSMPDLAAPSAPKEERREPTPPPPPAEPETRDLNEEAEDDPPDPSNPFAMALKKKKGRMKATDAGTELFRDPVKESEAAWQEAVSKMPQDQKMLIINDLDFTDMDKEDDQNPFVVARQAAMGAGSGGPPPPPSMGRPGAPPPPPSLAGLSGPPPPPPMGRAGAGGLGDGKATLRLHWREASFQPPTAISPGVFWQKIKPPSIDCQKLGSLFETKTGPTIVAAKKKDAEKKQQIIVLGSKRSNNINIALRKLPPPKAIKTAIQKFDANILNKEGIQKILKDMLPSAEEKEKIETAAAEAPDIPLGSAEQFLHTIGSIPELCPRLKLWLFMLDYANAEKEISDPLMDLKLCMTELEECETFANVMATLLAMGNSLNNADAKGFQLDDLPRVMAMRDTVHKHSLVHHACAYILEAYPTSSDLYSELGATARCSKVDFRELKEELDRLEGECKRSWEYLRLVSKNESAALKEKISEFLSDCAQRITRIKVIHRRVHNRFYKWLMYMGTPPEVAKDMQVSAICKVITEFALDYRNSRDRILQMQRRAAEKRERNKTRGRIWAPGADGAGAVEGEGGAQRSREPRDPAVPAPPPPPAAQLNSQQRLRHEEMSKILTGQGEAAGERNWQGTLRRTRQREGLTGEGGAGGKDGKEESPDDEILDGLVKAATVRTDSTVRDRRKARQFNRKSLRRTRTLKLVEDQTDN